MADNSVSILLDQFLDQLGFSENDIKERICTFDKCTIARTLSARKIQKRDDIDRIFVGSQREGIGLLNINDTDVLQIYKSCYCFESSNIADQKILPEAWLELDGTRTLPGHYLLKAHGAFEKIRLYGDIQHLLTQRYGVTFLSANKFMATNDDMFATSNGYLGTQTVFMQRQGPSWPKTVNTFEKSLLESLFSRTVNGNIDYVRGLPCICSTILTNWSCRERKGYWPSKETMQYVVDLPAFMVPVAEKGTAHADLQWRLCFTLGEMYLLRTLNNTHMKVYVILKCLAKHVLRPVCNVISSFIMKNVLFWQAETTPFNDFRPDTLVTCVRKALKYLKECLQRKYIPYYMIPERNLILNRISPKQRTDALQKLDHIMKYGVTHFNKYMLNESQHPTYCLEKIVKDFYFGRLCSKQNICKVSVLNAVNLAIYSESLFNKRNYLSCLMYHVWTIVIPMAYTYGLNVIINPLSVHIPLRMDVLGSFQRSRLINSERSVCKTPSYGENFIKITGSVREIVLAGDIIQVEELYKYAIIGTNITIHVYWKLHENIAEENVENKHEQVKGTVEIKGDQYSYDKVGTNNTPPGLFVRLTWMRYMLFLELMLGTAFCINLYSNQFDIFVAACFADECYLKLLTTIFEIILMFITVWKCGTCCIIDVYILCHKTQEQEERCDQTSCRTRGIEEQDHRTVIIPNLIWILLNNPYVVSEQDIKYWRSS